uniref:Uncharacterized protein n=1 Tax=Ananas comosus var. bracteatus TaxID=296719 RepID=A0A6V7QTG5_ANACO
MNIALLTKWWWHFLSDTSLHRGNHIRHLYYSRRKPLWEWDFCHTSFAMLEDVLAIRAMFKCGLAFSLGNRCTPQDQSRSGEIWGHREGQRYDSIHALSNRVLLVVA